ncbi:MAG: TldD/PmbA family protein, partial [Candidatus Moranbacteria bacterium]|nr:TldD/PmbA family protein [Candidatus Moranbacteria bacterium]
MKKPELKIHAKYCLEKLIDFGAEKAQVRIEMSDKHELNSAVGEMSLYRTISDTSIELTAIKDGKKGSMKINKLNEKNIDEAAKEAVEAAMSSQSDSANDISEFAEFKEFKNGKDMPDFEMMYDKLKSFLEYSNKKYPNVIIEESI